MANAAVSRGPAGDTASRLELARGVLRGLEDRAAGVRPVVPAEADHRVLPVAGPLARLLPMGGLRRGSTVAVPSGPASTSLLLALLAEASTTGAWVGVVGRPELGLVAAAEAGVRLERLALVPHPGADLVAVASALLDGLDIVVVAGAQQAGVRAADRQRLAARARQRGSVLLPLGPWPGADAELTCGDVQWQGVEAGSGRGSGSGRLCSRRIQVRLHGRGVAPGGRAARLWLPASDGGVGVPTEAPFDVRRDAPVPARVAG